MSMPTPCGSWLRASRALALVMPAMLAATGIHALLQAAGEDGDDRHAKIREAIDAFTGTSEVLATMVP
ncbi:hypothetical protein ACGF0J_22185 [Nonomuraea sp. NPDC047897]|uniref:hypothetical protein n=1 Tax=Nonomuraea sp. NPDC047897 TaxID=3364346 RepID=UPI0037160B3C